MFTYIGADLAYRAGAVGEWARTPAAVVGCLLPFVVAVAGASAIGAIIGCVGVRIGAK